MKNPAYLILCLAAIAILLSAGCTQNTGTPAGVTTPVPAAPATTAVSADTVKTAGTSLGTVLTDTKGMTLYFFATDIPGSGKSVCYNQCAAFWPIFYTPSPAVSPPLARSDFSTVTRDDGTPQTAYKGWPLYYFARDTAPGETKGENVQGNWSVAKPDYTVMYAQQPATGTFLTDGSGRTLYFLATENKGEVACSGACLAKWPAFSAGPLVAPSILKAADFSVTTRPDGVRQSLYKGRLLYYFVNDTRAGDTMGEGFNKVWYVANITGSVPPVPAPAGTPVPTPTKDYGSSSDSGSSGSGSGGDDSGGGSGY